MHREVPVPVLYFPPGTSLGFWWEDPEGSGQSCVYVCVCVCVYESASGTHSWMGRAATAKTTETHLLYILWPLKKKKARAGLVVEWLSSCTLLCWPRVCRFGDQVWTYILLVKPCCDGIPYKVEEDWHRC